MKNESLHRGWYTQAISSNIPSTGNYKSMHQYLSLHYSMSETTKFKDPLSCFRIITCLIANGWIGWTSRSRLRDLHVVCAGVGYVLQNCQASAVRAFTKKTQHLRREPRTRAKQQSMPRSACTLPALPSPICRFPNPSDPIRRI
jgi:hypothetical protein